MADKYTDCTLLVNSCDSYSDLWEPYFKLLEVFWPDCPFPIVLNTESKTFKHDKFDIKTFSMYTEENKAEIPWGQRLIETLSRIETKYILFTLDDYYLKAPPNVELLRQCFEWMEENPNISVFYFLDRLSVIKDNKYPGFAKIPLEREYRIKCQMGLWRRDKLLSYIMPHESPWQWETEGTIRCRQYKDDFYAVDNDSTLPKVFSYSAVYGGAVHRGRWVRKVIKPLNKTYNLGIDFTGRGFYHVHRERLRNASVDFLVKALKVTRLYPLAKRVYRFIFRKN